MRNNILFVLLILFSFYNCYAAKEKEREISVYNEKYVFTSKDAEQYYQMTPDSVKYVCCNTDSLPMAVFMPNDQLCNGIKENIFDVKSEEKIPYYTIKTIVYKDIVCRIIIYNYTGESDIDFLNIQINSYKDNKLIDRLLLDSRFISEIMYYNDFTITKDFVITLHKYHKTLVEIDENGDIIGGVVNPKVHKETVRYFLDNTGLFQRKKEAL